MPNAMLKLKRTSRLTTKINYSAFGVGAGVGAGEELLVVDFAESVL